MVKQDVYPPIEWQHFQPAPVMGVDEAGRGCLAGPVFSAVVILSDNKPYPDSKTITPKKRKALAEEIMTECIYAVGMASVEEINRLNILQATFLSMKRAVLQLSASMGHILVDGPFTIPNLPTVFKQTALIKGDKRAFPIAAASIIAKVKRDAWMQEQDKKHPHYGFAIHKGYATKRHQLALKEHGPCVLHRRDFIMEKPNTLNKGKVFEDTALKFFQKQDWKLMARNKKFKGVEIDLILKNKKGWLLVEVKSDNKWRTELPMSLKQKERLSRAFYCFCEQHNEPVQIQLAIVNKNHQVQVFPLEL